MNGEGFNKMKTFRQCAAENGVTVQAVYQAIKRAPKIYSQHLTKNSKGVQVIAPEGERLLVEHFKGEISDQTLNEPLNGLNEPLNEPLNSLNEPLNVYLRRLIDVRDQEIKRLLDQNQVLAENNRALTLIIAEHTRVKAIPYQDIIKEAQVKRDDRSIKRALNRLMSLFKDV
jgi:predicted DNA-binding protein YlxM (UPF0122 family)